MEHIVPVCQYEEFTIHTSSVGATSNTKYTCTLPVPIKDIVEASIISAHIPVRSGTVTPVYYISIDELRDRRTDYAPANAPATSTGAGNTHQIDTTNSPIRNALGVVYPDNTATSTYIIFKDRYQITTEYFNPIRSLDKLSITILNATGAVADDTSTTSTFITFRFKCKRKNFC